MISTIQIYIYVQLTINQVCYHLTIVKVYKTNFPLVQDNNNSARADIQLMNFIQAYSLQQDKMSSPV